MKKLHFSVVIKASKEKVWHTMLDDVTYRDWTSTFNPGSYYIGDWSRGSKMLFLGPNPDGSGEGGMVSRIVENTPNEFLSIEHIGMIKAGVEDTASVMAKQWTPAFENYTFNEVDGGTEVRIDIDIPNEYAESFDTMWNAALTRLKAIAE